MRSEKSDIYRGIIFVASLFLVGLLWRYQIILFLILGVFFFEVNRYLVVARAALGYRFVVLYFFNKDTA